MKNRTKLTDLVLSVQFTYFQCIKEINLDRCLLAISENLTARVNGNRICYTWNDMPTQKVTYRKILCIDYFFITFILDFHFHLSL